MKESLAKNKYGKIVSKKRSANMKKRYANSQFKAWLEAMKAARKALGVVGFQAVGGKSAAKRRISATHGRSGRKFPRPMAEGQGALRES